jgi:hypothetical protein
MENRATQLGVRLCIVYTCARLAEWAAGLAYAARCRR